MKNLRNILMCACLFAALCAASADTPVNPVAAVPAPVVPLKNETTVPAKETAPASPSATKVEPIVPKNEGTITEKVVTPVTSPNKTDNGTAAAVVPGTPAGTPTAPNNTMNTTDTNANKTVTPVNPIAPSPVVPPANATAAANVTAAPTAANVTTAPVTEKMPTAAPASVPVHTASGRFFDGLSFIGGMVLAVGLLGIGHVALKIYKNRSENQNYLTL